MLMTGIASECWSVPVIFVRGLPFVVNGRGEFFVLLKNNVHAKM